MHLYLFVRGIQHQVDIWRTLMQGHFFQWKRTNLKTGKEEISLVQGALRPSILGSYEYVFPEEALVDVLSILGYEDGMTEKFKLKLLRPIFNCRAIPKDIMEKAKKTPSTMTIQGTSRGLGDCRVPGIAVLILGIKDDIKQKWEEIGYYQEML